MTSLRLGVLAVLIAIAAPSAAAPAAAPDRPRAVRIVVHVPLALNDHTPVEPAMLRDYVRSLAALGPVVEHAGRGSYAGDRKQVGFDPVDHVVVTSTWPWAGVVVRKVLVRMRRDLRQDATLAEALPDPGTWRGEEHRTQFEILAAPPHRACRKICIALHRLLDTEGGGASEYADDRDGTHVMSSVPKARAAYVRDALRHMHAFCRAPGGVRSRHELVKRGEWSLRRARADESDAVAAVFRVSKETALPYLPDLHTREEDRAFFREHVFGECEVWVAERDGVLAGFCAFRQGWIDHLYVHPAHQHAGIGAALLRKAMAANERLALWTFQRNANGRAFYEAHGFRCVKLTDGRDNEEREPDALYAWSSPRAATDKSGG